MSIKKSKVLGMMVICKRCGYQNTPDQFDGSNTIYHDLKCPKCGAIDIDTSQILKECRDYGFGANNLIIPIYRYLLLEPEPMG
jgi:predicted nucleic-acid-binding Zn-ribbon protein